MVHLEACYSSHWAWHAAEPSLPSTIMEPCPTRLATPAACASRFYMAQLQVEVCNTAYYCVCHGGRTALEAHVAGLLHLHRCKRCNDPRHQLNARMLEHASCRACLLRRPCATVCAVTASHPRHEFQNCRLKQPLQDLNYTQLEPGSHCGTSPLPCLSLPGNVLESVQDRTLC